MIVKMEEYDICIRAAMGNSENGKCTISHCNNQAEFDLNLRFDTGDMFNYQSDICGKHLILNIIDYMTRS